MAICKLITMKKTLPKPTLLELDEYDMNKRVIEVLTHVCSHAILFSIVDEPKDALKISEETQLSLSNVYKTLVNLEKLTLVTIEKFDKIEGKKINDPKHKLSLNSSLLYQVGKRKFLKITIPK